MSRAFHALCQDATSTQAGCRARRRRQFAVEALESRSLLSVVTWTGAGDGSHWSNASNWDSHLPLPGDAVVIPDMPGAPTVVFDDNAGVVSLSSLLCFERLSVEGGSLTVTNPGEFNFNNASGGLGTPGTLRYAGGTLSGFPVITDGRLELDGGSSPVTFTLARVSTLSAAAVGAGQSLWVKGGSGGADATLTVETDLSNSGLIRLEPSTSTFACNLSMGPGRTLVNQAAGQFIVARGAHNGANPGGIRTLEGSFTNKGVFTIESNLTFKLVNTGLLRLESGIFSVGAATIGAGAVTPSNPTVAGGAVEFAGGTLVGTPLMYGTQLSITTASAGSFVVGGPTTLTGDLAAGQSLYVQSNPLWGGTTLTSAAGFTNAGLISLESLGGTGGGIATLTVTTGTLVNTGTLQALSRIDAPGFSNSRAIAAEINNSGLVDIAWQYDGTPIGRANAAHVNTGTWRVRRALAGAPDTPVTVRGSSFTQNAGVIEVLDNVVLRFEPAPGQGGGCTVWLTGGSVVGSITTTNCSLALGAGVPASIIAGGGTLLLSDVHAGQTVWIQGRNYGGNALLQSPTGFRNDGTLRLEPIESAYSCAISTGGTGLENHGTILVNRGSGALGGPRTFTGPVANHNAITVEDDQQVTFTPGTLGSLRQIAGSLNLGMISIASMNQPTVDGGTLSVEGGSIIGVPVLRNARLALLADIPSIFVLGGLGNTLQGDIGPQQTVWLRGMLFTGGAKLTSPAFTNHGVLRLESDFGGADLSVPTGTFTNSGSFIVAAGYGGSSRNIEAEIVNSGSVDISYSFNFGPFGRSGANHVNTGQFTVTGVGTTVTLGGQSFTQAGGTLSVVGGASLIATLAPPAPDGPGFAFTGGQIVGVPVLLNTPLHLLTTNAGEFIAKGTVPIVGEIAPAQTVRVVGSNAGGAATLTASSLVNSGTLVMENTDQAHAVTLAINALVNHGTLQINRALGGPRTITGAVTTTGSIVVQANQAALVQNRANGADAAFTLAGGTVSVLGRLTVEQGDFVFSGGSLAGRAVLFNADLHLQHDGPASFVLAGFATGNEPGPRLFGTVAAGQTVWARGSSAYGNSVVTAPGGLVNHGIIRLESIDAAYTSTLTITASGGPGDLVNTGTIDVAVGTGGQRAITVAGSATNAGTIRLSPAATLTVNGTLFAQTSSGFLELQASGLNTSSKVNAAGVASLRGVLSVVFVNGYELPRDVLTVPAIRLLNAQQMGTGAGDGAFAIVSLPPVQGRKYMVNYNTDGVPQFLEVLATSLADLDSNGYVNGDDSDLFSAAYDLADQHADVDGNGYVNGDDFDLFTYAFDAG